MLIFFFTNKKNHFFHMAQLVGWLVGSRISSYNSAYWEDLASFAIETFHQLKLQSENSATYVTVMHAHISHYTAKVLELYILPEQDSVCLQAWRRCQETSGCRACCQLVSR